MRALVTLTSAALLSGCGGSGLDESAGLTLATSGAGNPTASVAASGVAYFAWIETRDSVSNVLLARVDSSDRVAPVRVNDTDGDAAPHEQAPPQVVTGPGDAVYVVWQNNTHIPGRRFPASNLRFARSLDGGRTFEPAIFVNDDAHDVPSSHTFHDVAVADDGTIIVSWIDGRERSRAEAAGGAAPATMHDHHGSTLPGSQVRVARSTDGGRTFSSGVVVYDDVCPCCRTSLAVSGAQVAVAFRSAAQNVRDIIVVRSTDHGATFGAPVRVHSDGWQIESCPHAGASLAFGGDGRLHVSWYTGAEERQGLWYARATADGSDFESPQAVQTGGWIPVSQVKLAPDRDGGVWLAWDDRRAEEPVVRVARASSGVVRSAITELHGQSPALGAAGALAVAWQHGDSASARVLRSRN